MRKWLLTFICFLGSSAAFCQTFPSEVWHDGGFVVLISNDTLTGSIKYDLQNNLIQVRTATSTQSFSARKTVFFRFFDQTAERYRTFYALPYAMENGYKTLIFFELLVEGPLILLAREYIVQDTNPINTFNFNPFFDSQLVMKFDFYFLPKNGELIKYTMKKKHLWLIMKKRKKEIIDFMDAKRLRHDRLEDIVRITSYYNSIVE